jgi:hypothetical protein
MQTPNQLVDFLKNWNILEITILFLPSRDYEGLAGFSFQSRIKFCCAALRGVRIRKCRVFNQKAFTVASALFCRVAALNQHAGQNQGCATFQVVTCVDVNPFTRLECSGDMLKNLPNLLVREGGILKSTNGEFVLSAVVVMRSMLKSWITIRRSKHDN